jgi:DNA-binding MarR family transcriptional regulator
MAFIAQSPVLKPLPPSATASRKNEGICCFLKGHMPFILVTADTDGLVALRWPAYIGIMAKRNDADDNLPCCATAMRKATRRLTQLYDDALERCGLRSTQFAILAELDFKPGAPPTMAELARLMVMDRSALGHNLQPLLRDGLVVLKESAEDRRRRHVALTAQGRAKMKVAVKLWNEAEERFRAVFGASRAAKLRATLLEIARDDRLATLSDESAGLTD